MSRKRLLLHFPDIIIHIFISLTWKMSIVICFTKSNVNKEGYLISKPTTCGNNAEHAFCHNSIISIEIRNYFTSSTSCSLGLTHYCF